MGKLSESDTGRVYRTSKLSNRAASWNSSTDSPVKERSVRNYGGSWSKGDVKLAKLRLADQQVCNQTMWVPLTPIFLIRSTKAR